MFTNPSIVGEGLANPESFWYKFWITIQNGGWTIFNQMELLIFIAAIPIGLAKNAKARAAIESLLIYLTFNYFINQYFNIIQYHRLTLISRLMLALVLG